MGRRLALHFLKGALFVLALAAWIAFAPIPLGGRAGYVIVSGNSMEPTLHAGDLVIVRQTADYEVGDVVAYREPWVGLVIHRIIAREGLRYVLQGDNNTWRDPYRPLKEDIVGELWLHLPRLGQLAAWLRSPSGLALLAALGGAIILLTQPAAEPPVGGQARRKRRVQRMISQPFPFLGERQVDLLALFGVLALASVLLGVPAFRQPVSRTVKEELPYQHVGRFSYTASLPMPGALAVYDDGQLQSGDPVFRSVVDRVLFTFEYDLVADAPARLTATYDLQARVGDDSGWQRVIALHPQTTLESTSFAVSGTLDLNAVQDMIDALEAQIGRDRPHYIVTVIPTIHLEGSLASEPFSDDFAPRLTFWLNDTQMWLVEADPFEKMPEDPLRPSVERLFYRSRTEPNSLQILGTLVPVSTARRLALVGLVMSLGGMVAVGWASWRAAHYGEVESIRFRYGSRLVAVRDYPLPPPEQCIRVATIEDLVKLADGYGGKILHTEDASGHWYYVQGEGVLYYYLVPAEPLSEQPPPQYL